MTHILYLDDYHAADVHFVQSLARGIARMNARPAPLIVHGSGEHAERVLEANGIFRHREDGILPIESVEEHVLVERAGRHINQKIVASLNDAVVPSVGIMGTQRRSLILRAGRVTASVGWIEGLMKQGIVPVVAAFARDGEGESSGEVHVADAVTALADAIESNSLVVFFTKTNLPGLMKGGSPIDSVRPDHEKLRKSVPDWAGFTRVLDAGRSVLLTNTTRLADDGGPVGTRIRSSNS